MQLTSYDEHEAITTPSGDALPVVLRVPPKPFSWRTVGWCLAGGFGVFVLSVALAVTMMFLVDMTALGGGLYAAGVVLSSASLGALVSSAVWSIRGRRA